MDNNEHCGLWYCCGVRGIEPHVFPNITGDRSPCWNPICWFIWSHDHHKGKLYLFIIVRMEFDLSVRVSCDNCILITHGKVSRRLATAHVNFSTMICVKYGDDKAKGDGRFPCIEIRIVKSDRSHDFLGGITNPKVTCVVTTKSSFSDQPGSGLKHREAKLENNCLPNLAQGAWHVRHRLLNGSPLLKKEYRENGDWPTGYNYGKGVEGALSFESINVIFTGKSNLTAKTCFKTFQYKVTDVKYGVRFKYLGYVRSDDPSNEEYFIINFEEWNSTESQNNP